MINKLNLIAKVFGVSLLVFLSAPNVSSQCTGGEVPNSCNATGECGPNLLRNPSFEAGGVTGWLYSGCGSATENPFTEPCGFFIRDGWSTFNAGAIRDSSDPFTPCNPQSSAPVAPTGKNYLKMWDFGGTFLANEIVNNGGPTNWPLVTPGKTYCASVKMSSPAARLEGCDEDHLTGDKGAVIRIEYWLADNTLCQLVTSPKFDATYANDSWYTMSVQGIAPAGAVRANVIMVMVGNGSGAVYFDDVSFSEKLSGEGVASGSIACNDEVNVSVNGDCSVDLHITSLVEGSNGAGYSYRVLDEVGNEINLDDVSSIVGSHNASFKYEVYDFCGGESTCWGYINFEDKSDPQIICADCTDPLVTSPGCIFNCTEEKLFSTWVGEENRYGYDDGLLDALIPSDADDFIDDYVTDNCGSPVTAGYRDSFSAIGDCTEGSIMTRTWVVNYDRADGSVGTVTCQKYYKFLPINAFDAGGNFIAQEAPYTEVAGICVPTIDVTVEDVILMPKRLVEIPTCNVAIDPLSLQAFFDTATTIDEDTDDDGIDPDEGDVDCVVEANEGTWMAFPHYYASGLSENHLYGGFIQLRGTPHAQAITEVCNTIVKYTDVLTESCAVGCNGNTKTLRTWTVLDWCAGTFAEYQQIIKVTDITAPTIEVENIIASVDPWECNADVLVPAPQISDNCDTGLTYEIGFVEGALQVTGNATDGYVIHNVPIGTTEFEYVAVDCCDNRRETRASITVADNTAPVPVTKENLVVELQRIGGHVPTQGVELGTAKLHTADIDNGSYDSCTDVMVHIRRNGVCNDEDEEWGDFVTFCCADLGGSASTTIKVELRVCDWNGNCNYLDANVLLEDKENAGPGSCPSDVVLKCTDDIWDFELTGLPGSSYTTCQEVPVELTQEELDELLENTEPRLKRFNQGGPTLGKYFGIEVPAYNPECGFGAFRRTSDNCPDQWFVIEPLTTTTYDDVNEVWLFDSAFDPSTIVWPEDITVECGGYEAGSPTWVDVACQLVGSEVVTEVINFEADACQKILNHWTVVDFCKYDPSRPDAFIYKHTQVIKVIDVISPEVTSEDDLCFGVNTDECTRKGISLSAVGTDEGECQSAWIGWTINVDYDNDWEIDCIFTTNTNPLLSNGEPNPKWLAKTTSGEAVTINLEEGLAKNTEHRVEWVVNDGCGNRGSYTTVFTVEDKKAPTPYCLNLGTAVMSNGEVELWAIDFNQGSFDNCSASETLLYTFTDVPPPPRCDEEYDSQTDLQWYDGSFWFFDSSEATDDDDRDCPIVQRGAYDDGGYDAGTGQFESYSGDTHKWFPGFRSSGAIFKNTDVDATGFLQIPIYVWDECGQLDFCLVQLRVVDNGGGMVAGNIRTEDNRLLPNIETQIMSNTPGYPKYSMTDASGGYAFDNNALTQDYEVTGTKNDDYLNGVSTIDLVKVQRHILGLELLDTPYKMIAADINDDNKINGQDLVELRKLILGIYTELPQNSSWKLVNAKQSLTLSNPWNYDEMIRISEMADDMMDQNFIGVKIGDLNGSVEVQGEEGRVSNPRGTTLNFSDVEVEKGEEITVTMTTEEAMYGYQFTMDMSQVSLQQITGSKVTEGNVAVFEGVMTMSKASAEAMTGELFTMTLVANASGKVSELLGMNSSITKAEAYVGANLETVDLNLQGERTLEFSLGQNEPNPFKDQTTIEYSLPVSSSVTMTLYDVTGKVLQVIKEQGQKGSNKMTVNKEQLRTGVVYYKLETGEYTATRHMIVIE